MDPQKKSLSMHDSIHEIFKQKLGVVVPSLETDLFESGTMDSLKFVDLVYNLEQTFDIVVPIESLEVDQFRTIAEIVRLVEQCKQTQPQSS
jgi:D-alanine--poly(phosphoribitol) ligase subunit 2